MLVLVAVTEMVFVDVVVDVVVKVMIVSISLVRVVVVMSVILGGKTVLVAAWTYALAMVEHAWVDRRARG